jgi:Ribbon-helix-helix protein, copG family.
MAGCVVHVRVPQQVLSQLDALCGAMEQTRSATIRQSVQYVLDHPELWPELLAHPVSTAVEDLRTPEQVEAWERNKHKYIDVDLSPLLHTTPPA